MAALQGAIVLITVRRPDQVSAELATHDDRTNFDAVGRIASLEAIVSETHASVTGATTASTERDDE